MWERRGGEVPEAWYRLPIFYFSNVSEIRGPDDPIWSPGGVARARLRAGGGGRRRHAGRRPRRPSVPRRRSAATRSSTTGRRATSSARRPPSGSGRPRARTSPARSGRGWSRRTSWPTPDRGTGYDLAMTAEVNGTETSRGRWSDAQFSFGEMLARASADVAPAAGRPDRQRHGRDRLPARGPRRDARPLSRARRRGRRCASSDSAPSATRSWPEPRDRPCRSTRDPAITHRADDGRRLADGPAHLRRGDRHRRRDARARGARLGPFRPLAPGRMPARRPLDGAAAVLGWTALGGYSARRVYRGVAWESVYVGASPRAVGASAARCSKRSSRPPRRPATGRCSPASWPRTRRASPSTSGSGSGGSASSARLGPGRARGAMARRRPARTAERGRRRRPAFAARSTADAGHSQPRSRASRAAAMRFVTPSFPIASDR